MYETIVVIWMYEISVVIWMYELSEGNTFIAMVEKVNYNKNKLRICIFNDCNSSDGDS